LDMVEAVEEQGFSAYIQAVEADLRSLNFRNSHFNCLKLLDATHQLLKESRNLNQVIYAGLLQSYTKHYTARPYLFLAECFYYALESWHNKKADYVSFEVNFEQSQLVGLEAWGGLLDEAMLEEALSPQFLVTVQKMSKKEVGIFKRLAELVIYDEDEEYYLYAPVSDAEIQLYKDFGIGNAEFLLMEEFGLINMGSRILNLVEVNSEPAGFQNDNLVFYFTTDQEPFDIQYRSYSFTSVGLKLLDILAIETSDQFFLELTEIFQQQHERLGIAFGVEGIK
ncbi:MAG: hypothetical protein Q4A21_00005, partial [bacterium]|nr:hypothetical protein [bacterium]